MKMKEQMNKRGKMKMKKEDIISFTWHQPSDFSMKEIRIVDGAFFESEKECHFFTSSKQSFTANYNGS